MKSPRQKAPAPVSSPPRLDSLDAGEQLQRKKLEAIVLKHRIGFADTMEALWILKRDRLYRSTHASFKDYCADVFGYSEDWANRLVDARETLQIAEQISENESRAPGAAAKEKPAQISVRKARPLRGLPAKQKEKVLRKALKEGEGKLPAAKRLKEIAEEVLALPRGGLAADARREKLQAEAAKLRGLGRAKVDTGSPPPPIDAEASDGWTPAQVKRIHSTIDQWAAQVDPDKARAKFQTMIESIKALFK